jgi:hypothetical protein
VRGVVQHVADCLAWYAHDLVAGPVDVPGPDQRWPDDLPPAALAAQVAVAAEVLARVVDAAAPQERGWHPWGVSDAAGFAAVGAAELLLHGDDLAGALDLPWDPPAPVAAAVLDRLFPGVAPHPDPWTALRWATGRADLPGRARVSDWRYALAVPGER